MTKQQFKADAIAKGWKPDKYSHVQHKNPQEPRVYRLKLQKIAWRKEVKTDKTEWTRIGGGYYSHTSEAPLTPVPRP